MKGIPFTPEQEAQLRQLYPNTPTKTIAEILGRKLFSIYNKATALGLKKTPEFLQSEASGRLQKGQSASPGTCFKKGQTPFNKGKKQSEFMTPEGIEKSKAGCFKKGQMPHNTRKDHDISIRAKRTTNEVYKYIRVAPAKWELYHRFLWQQAYGPIPPKMVLTFKDGDTLNCDLDNLELITMAENALRNSASANLTDGYIANCLAWRDPEMQQEIRQNHPELIQTAKLNYQLNRKIKQHGKE